MKITLYSSRDDSFRLRMSTIFACIICLMLGIQGIFSIFDSNYTIPNIKLYSSLLVVISIIGLTLSVLKISDYESL